MNKILEIKFGSSLYGTSTPESDIDLKAIYLPSAHDIVLGRVRGTIQDNRKKAQCERNTKDDTDIEIFSLCRYLELLTEGQTVALDILFGYKQTLIFSTDLGLEIMQKIYDNRNRLITRNVNSFVGYARQQAARYGIKGSRMDALKRTNAYLDNILDKEGPYTRLTDDWVSVEIERLVKECSQLISLEKQPLVEIVNLKGPTGKIDQLHLRVNGRSIPFHATVKYAKEVVGKMLHGYGQRAHKAHLAGGIDWKALSHAVRVNAEALELLSTGEITFPCQNKELLLQVKKGELPYEQVAEMIEEGLSKLHIVNEISSFPDKPDQEFVDNLIYDIYSDVVRSNSK